MAPRHLSLDREVVHHGLSKSNKIVRNKCHTGDQQGGPTDQHVHSGQFLGNRMVGNPEHRMSVSSLRTPSYADCHFEQLRTQSQAGMLGSRQVDLETHSVGLHNEPYHAPAPGELGEVTHRQDTWVADHPQDLLEPTLL